MCILQRCPFSNVAFVSLKYRYIMTLSIRHHNPHIITMNGNGFYQSQKNDDQDDKNHRHHRSCVTFETLKPLKQVGNSLQNSLPSSTIPHSPPHHHHHHPLPHHHHHDCHHYDQEHLL